MSESKAPTEQEKIEYWNIRNERKQKENEGRPKKLFTASSCRPMTVSSLRKIG